MITSIRITWSLILLIFISGCTKESKHTTEHDEPEAISHTLYSDRTEIFVEFSPLVVGNITRFAAHFTVLGDTFRPLTEGKVTVSLIVNGKGIRQSSDKPEVPGIYRLALKPDFSGTGELIFEINTKDFNDKLIIKNVVVYADKEAAIQNSSEGSSADEISFLKEQAWKIDFASDNISSKPFNEVIRTNGMLRSAPAEESAIVAVTSGIIRLMPDVVNGAFVKSGQPVFVLTGEVLNTDNLDMRNKTAAASFEKAKSDYDRAQKLIEDKIISQKEYDNAKLAFTNAKIAYEAFYRNYSSNGLRINSPIEGYITDLNISSGQFVESGTRLGVVSKNKLMLLQANVSQRYFNVLPSIVSANFILPGSDSVYNIDQLNGKLLAFGKALIANSAFIPVTFQFKNPGDLLPNTPAQVFLKTSAKRNSLIIPKSALIEEQGSVYVYIQTGGESFVKREVKIGATDGLNVEILNGLKEGERVVTKGAFQIKLSTAGGSMPAHGHEH